MAGRSLYRADQVRYAFTVSLASDVPGESAGEIRAQVRSRGPEGR
jgi:hypothetical protein